MAFCSAASVAVGIRDFLFKGRLCARIALGSKRDRSSTQVTRSWMANQLHYDATLVERRDLSPDLATFRIELDDSSPGPNWYQGGQYLIVGLNNLQSPELGSVTRPLSLASAAESGALVEFFVRRVAEPASPNPLTHLLWKLKPGDRLHASARAAGRFTLKDTIGEHCPQRKILVAAGTGLAPFISMLRDRLGQSSSPDLRDFALLRGACTKRELGFEQEIAHWVENAGLVDLSTVSRPHKCPEWSGLKGRVEDFFLPERLGALCDTLGLERISPSNSRVLICGLQGTITQCIERLLPLGFIPDRRSLTKALGLPRNIESHVYFEQYDETPIFDLRDPEVVSRLKSLLPRSIAA